MDLNCDLGESFGVYHLGDDKKIMQYITSANIACGFHAGDPLVMAATVSLAREAGVRVGAHPGYPDLQGFGRREMKIGIQEVEALLLYQLGALAAFARVEGVDLVHVKLHGALYNQAASDRVLAQAVARAVRCFSRDLILVGLAGSFLIEEGQTAGLRVASEAFPDRAYSPDGTLRPRGQPGAVIHDSQEVAENALSLALQGISISRGETHRVLPVDTLCLHGDMPGAVENARLIREKLESAGIALQPLA